MSDPDGDEYYRRQMERGETTIFMLFRVVLWLVVAYFAWHVAEAIF